MASFTTLVTLVRMPASFGRSMMSSSDTVMNFRLGPLVSEMRNMLLDGVTGITTCTAPSTPLTTSRNFCLPASISSIDVMSSSRARRCRSLHLVGTTGEQFIDFGHDHVGARQIHVADPLPANDPVLIDHIDVGNKLPSAVQLISDLARVEQIGIGHFDGKRREKLAHIFF